MVNLVAQVTFQLVLIPSSEVDFIGCIESHDIIFFGGIFGNSDGILSVTFWLLGPRATMGDG